MNIAFKTEKLRKQMRSKAELLKAFGLRAKKLSLRIDEIEDSKNLRVLQSLPALNCHQLTKNPLGEWILNVTPDFFMIFVLDENPVPLDNDGFVRTELVNKICIIGFF